MHVFISIGSFNSYYLMGVSILSSDESNRQLVNLLLVLQSFTAIRLILEIELIESSP